MLYTLWLGAKVLGGRVAANAKSDWSALSPKAKLIVIGIAAAVVLFFVHQHIAHKALKARYDAGYAQAVADIQAKEAAKVAPLRAAKAENDTKVAAALPQIRSTHDAQVDHARTNVADLLGMYARAEGRHDTGSGVLLSGADAAPGSGRAQAPGHDGLAEVAAGGPSDQLLIAIPAKQLAIRAGICDRDAAALVSWEETFAVYMVSYNEWLAKVKRVH